MSSLPAVLVSSAPCHRTESAALWCSVCIRDAIRDFYLHHGRQLDYTLCRRQWIQDTRAHMQQMEKSLLDVAQGFTTVAIPGNAELQGEVDAARQQEQLHLAQQDVALDKIHAAATRVADLGLGMMHELRVRTVAPPARLKDELSVT